MSDAPFWVFTAAGAISMFVIVAGLLQALLALGDEGRGLLGEAARTGSPRARDAARTMMAERGLDP